MFIIDNANNYSYDFLIEDLNKNESINNVVEESNLYEIYKKVFLNVLSQKHFYILDTGLSDTEKQSSLEGIKCETFKPSIKIKDREELIKQFFSSSFTMDILSSGTTGAPKRISHSPLTLFRTIKEKPKFHQATWGLCFNPTHYAGLQVFFQTLINSGTIVNLFNLNSLIELELILKHKVTNISMTPTYFKNKLSINNTISKYVKTVTFGGEKVDSMTLSKASELFPNAKVYNIYASTEFGSLLISDGEYFQIVDPNLVKIEDNKVLVNRAMLSFRYDSEWYDSGDRVEKESSGKFKILARETDFVNIGGYSVNPNEVEEQINKLDYVLNSVVYSRKNSVLGNILVAEIVVNKQVSDIDLKKELKSKLQDWKIPSKVLFVDDITTSRTGKKLRKS